MRWRLTFAYSVCGRTRSSSSAADAVSQAVFTLIIFIKIDVNYRSSKLLLQRRLVKALARNAMQVDPGLEGVIAAETVLSEVDGQAGRLTIRGHLLEELAGHCSFEAVLQILLDGLLELPGSEAALQADLARARAQVFALLPPDRDSCRRLPPIEVLRAWIAQLPDGDDYPTALQLLAAPAVFTAAILRIRAGDEPVAPEPCLRHAADFLRMLRNAPASDYEAAALDSYLVTVADHGLNASTFTARVVASTRAGLTSAVIAALSALKGPLHGGAPGPVLDMLDAIGQPERARLWIEAALQRNERLMGFGHRIYRVRDPRADALRAALRALATSCAHSDNTVSSGQSKSRALSERLALAESVEREALRILHRDKPQRALDTNVEFYTALLLEALGVPREAFTCMFAVGRVGGWIAHAREQLRCGRLIRPQSRYIGPAPAPAAA